MAMVRVVSILLLSAVMGFSDCGASSERRRKLFFGSLWWCVKCRLTCRVVACTVESGG